MRETHNNPLLDSILAYWFPDGADTVSSRLPGGDLNDVFRVEKDGQAYALRLYTRTSTRDMVSEEQEVVRRLAERLPEVLPPIATPAGELSVEYGDRVAALSRFAEGERPDTSAPHREAAAGLLARVHAAAAELGVSCRRSTYPAIGDLNWLRSRWWNWEDVQAHIREASPDDCHGIEPSVILDRLTDSLDEIPQGIRTLRQRGLPLVQVHGDYYPGNPKARNGRITALLDWDETRVDWRAWEVARSLWEFCETAHGTLGLDAAHDFVDAYRAAGGSVLRREVDAFVTLMRADILWGVLYSFGHAQRAVDAERGLAMEWDHQAAQLSAMEGLREVSLA